jgi:hypothetical protein
MDCCQCGGGGYVNSRTQLARTAVMTNATHARATPKWEILPAIWMTETDFAERTKD